MKKLVSFILALALCLGLCVPALAAEFSDVPAGHAFYDAISWCAEKGIVGGYADGTFKPANTVTRSNFTVMLSRAFYSNEVAGSQTEANLAYGTFYPNFKVMFMYNALTNTSFGTWSDIQNPSVMNKGIARYDMVQLMTNIMSNNGFSASSAEKSAAIAKIVDYNSIPSQYKDAVANVYALGIIGGYSDGTFGGSVTMNRGQAAVVTYRLAQYLGDGSGVVSAVPVDDDLTNMPTSPNNIPADQSPSTNTENGTLTLRDGSAVTEANARKILETVMAQYPGENWLAGSRRNTDDTFNGYRLGGLSAAMNTITNSYYDYNFPTQHVSMWAGCGGLAGVASDAIFGGGGTGGENFPARKLSSVTQAKTGDIIVMLNEKGLATHYAVIASVGASSAGPNGTTKLAITKYDGGGTGGSTEISGYVFDGTLTNGSSTEVWTRYPD